MLPRLLAYTFLPAIFEISCLSQSCVMTAGGTFACPSSITGAMMNGVAYAAQFNGTDCGSKINTAATNASGLNGGSGVIQVDKSCGTKWTTSVTLLAGQMIQFVQGGQYSISAQITLAGTGSGVRGMECHQGWAFGVTSCPVQLYEANGANLAQMIRITGQNEFVSNIELNGNSSNQTAGGSGVNVTGIDATPYSGMRATIDHDYIHSFRTYGVAFTSTGANMEAAGAKVFWSTLQGNLSDGLVCAGTGDTWYSFSEFESNGGYGLDFSQTNGCPSPRININDIGGNASGGIYLGAGVYPPAGENTAAAQITANQFGNNGSHDISINGWSSTNSTIVGYGHLIVGNTFVGLCASTASCYGGQIPAANTYDAVHVVDSAGTSISSNVIYSASGASAVTYAYGVREVQVNQLGQDSIIGNVFSPYAAGRGFGSGNFTSANHAAIIMGNNEYNAPSLVQNSYLANETWLLWKDAGGTQRKLFTLDASNAVDIAGHPVKQILNLQADPGQTVGLLGLHGPGDKSMPCGGCYAASWYAPADQAIQHFVYPGGVLAHGISYNTDGSINDFNFLSGRYSFRKDASDNWIFPNGVTVGGGSQVIYRCSGGTYNGFLTASNTACAGGTATTTSLKTD